MRTPGRPGARRLLVLCGALMAAVALAVLVAGPGDGDGGDRPPAGEAGSRFRGATTGGTRTGDDRPSAAGTRRRVARLFVAGFSNDRWPQRVWGGLLVTDANYTTASGLRTLTRNLEQRARRADRPAPLFFADPQDLGGLAPAEAPEIGAEGTQADARREALRSARRVRPAGIDAVLAPSAELAVGGTPSERRGFGDDPRGVAAFVFQAVDGWRAGGVVPIPGRFPGEGDLRPFAGVVARAPAIQMSAALYAAWDGVTPATLLPDAVGLLRDRLGFDGAVLSADLVAATAATGGGVGEAAVEALRAGCDLLLVPGGRAEQNEAFEAVVTAVRQGKIPQARVTEALERAEALRRAAARL